MSDEALIGGRFLQYVGASVLWGTPLFFLYGLQIAPGSSGSGAAPSPRGRAALEPPRAFLARGGRWDRPLLLASAVTALCGACLWLLAETAALGGDAADASFAPLLWTVVSGTRFGIACAARIVLLAVAVSLCLWVRRARTLHRPLALLGAAVTMSFAWTGHGASGITGTRGFHLGSDVLHLLAAGIWLGALAPLAILSVRAWRSGTAEDGRALGAGLHAFSRIGVWVVAILLLSGIVNSLFLIDVRRWRDAMDSLYGRVLLVKLALVLGMLALAATNRYRSTPALDPASNRYRSTPALDPASSRHASLAASVRAAASVLSIETLLGVLVLGAVSILGMVAPPDG